MEGFSSGDRVIEWPEGRIEPQVVEFVWNDSSGNYEMFRYQAEPFLKNVDSGNSYGKDFTSTKRQTGFFGGNSSEPVGSSISSTVYPAGSILFIQEAFVGCESNTTTATGITISFGLRESDGSQISTGDFSPDLTTFGLSTTDEVIFPRTSLANFATGSVFYSDSPVGIIRINRPMMIYMLLQGGSLAAGTFIKCTVPYIVDVNSVNAASGAAGVVGPPNQTSGGGSAIDLEEIAFGTGTGITSSNLFTFDNSNTNLILGNSTIFNSSYSNSISNNTGDICDSLYTTSISNYASKICGSNNSNIISSYLGFMTQSNYSSMISSYNSTIRETNHSVILGGGGGNTICSPGLGSSQYGGIVFGGGNLICDASESAIFNSGTSRIMGSTISFGNNILGGGCNKIYCSVRSGIIGGLCSSLTASTPATCFNSIIYSSHSQIVGNTFSRFNIIMGSTGSCIVNIACIGKGGSNCNSSNSLIIGGSDNKICGALNSLILGGSGITICGGCGNIGIVGKNDKFHNVVAIPSLIGNGSVTFNFSTASSDINLDNNHFTLLAFPPEPSGSMSVCLPKSLDISGRLYVIKKNGSSTQSTVNVCPWSGDCIDGYAGYVELINPWDYYMLQADGVDNWIKLGGAVGLNL